ncbi:MAG: nucleoside-diphosphate sugar epimerase/dehydratase [Acidimicrobiales bacterium]
MARSTASGATAHEAPAGNGDAPVHAGRPHWLTLYTGVLVAVDALSMAAATLTSNAAWLGLSPGDLHIRSFAIPYAALVLVTVPTWLAILALVGAYDLGPFGSSDRAVRARIARAGAQLLAVVAVSYYVVRLATLGRGILMALIPLGVAFTLVGRMGAAAGLHLARRRGHARRTAVVVGGTPAVEQLVSRVERSQAPAVTIVGVVVLDGTNPLGPPPGNGDRAGANDHAGGRNGHASGDGGDASADGSADGTGRSNGNGHGGGSSAGDGAGEGAGNGQPVAGTGGLDRSGTDRAQADPQVVAGAVARMGAETVVIAGALAPGRLRDIAWRLEGTGVDLLVTPGPGRGEGPPSARNPVPRLALPHPDV